MGKDFKEVAQDVKAAVEKEAEAVTEKAAEVVGVFRTKFGYPLHDPHQSVLITVEGVEAKVTAWLKGQIAAGTVEEVK